MTSLWQTDYDSNKGVSTAVMPNNTVQIWQLDSLLIYVSRGTKNKH